MARSNKKKKKRGIGRTLVLFIESVFAMAALAGIGFGIFAFAEKSKEFRITTMTIEGIELVSEESVAIASGVTQEDNLLLTRCSAVAERIAELPGVKACEVKRVFPDTLHVIVEERTPVATVLLRNHLYEIDDECVVVREVDTTLAHTGPFITSGSDLGVLEPGQAIESPALREALDVWNAFRTTEFASKMTVSELAAHSPNDIRMYCDELAYELRWGRGDYDRQAKRLDVLWEQQEENIGCYEYLDLRFGQMLACK